MLTYHTCVKRRKKRRKVHSLLNRVWCANLNRAVMTVYTSDQDAGLWHKLSLSQSALYTPLTVGKDCVDILEVWIQCYPPVCDIDLSLLALGWFGPLSWHLPSLYKMLLFKVSLMRVGTKHYWILTQDIAYPNTDLKTMWHCIRTLWPSSENKTKNRWTLYFLWSIWWYRMSRHRAGAECNWVEAN